LVAKDGTDMREVPESKVMRQPLDLSAQTPDDFPLKRISSSLTPNIYW
jgi:hypothetical protein